MSSRLFVTRVVDKAKVKKHWYAKPARSGISIAELFSQLRDGDIDGRTIDKKYIWVPGVQFHHTFNIFLFYICVHKMMVRLYCPFVRTSYHL